MIKDYPIKNKVFIWKILRNTDRMQEKLSLML
jgi:hypothetical protein